MSGKKQKWRRFNDAGLHTFALWLGTKEVANPPIALLIDPALTEELSACGEIEIREFSRKYDMGEHIVQALGAHWEAALDDAGLLAWLSLAFCESTMVSAAGKPYLGQLSRHLVSTDNQWTSYTHSHRHLVRSAIFFAGHFGKTSQVFLAGHPSQHSKIEEQISSRKTEGLPFSQPLAEALFRLYYNPETQKIHRGAASNRAGAIERFVKVIRQLDLTFDIHARTGTELVQLLPKEFYRFLNVAKT